MDCLDIYHFFTFVFRNWTEEQTKALRQSSLTIPPTAHNYWGCIAEAVPGKTAFECQTKHYESVVSSKNASQCTDGNTSSTNGKKRGRHPTAREQFSRYLQNVAGNVDIPSKVLEETSKMNGDDLFQVRIFESDHKTYIYIYINLNFIALCFVTLVIIHIRAAVQISNTQTPYVVFLFNMLITG